LGEGGGSLIENLRIKANIDLRGGELGVVLFAKLLLSLESDSRSDKRLYGSSSLWLR
jgi:hypothetical protein